MRSIRNWRSAAPAVVSHFDGGPEPWGVIVMKPCAGGLLPSGALYIADAIARCALQSTTLSKAACNSPPEPSHVSMPFPIALPSW